MKIDIKRGCALMRAISSHPAIKMRVLILSAALFACATGAPSGALVAPLSVVAPAIPVAPVPVAPVPVAPVNPGDLQGALIDAKVQTEDLLRAAADKNREAAEQVVEDTNEKIVENNDQARERSLEAFWAAEEKKWQALDAIKTAEAQIDGHIASTSDITAKSLVAPAIVAPIAPVVAPISPYYYTPGFIAPGLKAISTPFLQIQPEAPKNEERKEESKPQNENSQEIKNDSVQIESADLKTAEPNPEAPKEESKNVEQTPIVPEAPKDDSKYVVGQTPIFTPLALSPLNVATRLVSAPITLVQPELRTVAFQYPGQVYLG